MPKISYLIFVSFVDFHVANTFRIHMKKRRDASKYRMIYLKLNIALGTSNVVKGNKITMESGR